MTEEISRVMTRYAGEFPLQYPSLVIVDLIRAGRYEVNVRQLESLLMETQQRVGGHLLDMLLTELRSNQKEFELVRTRMQKKRVAMEKHREVMKQKEGEVERAESVSLEEVENKVVRLYGSEVIGNEFWVLCTIDESPLKKMYRFKPSHYQKMAILSWGIAPYEYPLEIRVIRSPRRGHFVFDRKATNFASEEAQLNRSSKYGTLGQTLPPTSNTPIESSYDVLPLY